MTRINTVWIFSLIILTFVMSVQLIGWRPEDGVPDMTVISNIDEKGINTNLKVRYDREQIYVSPLQSMSSLELH